MRVEQQNQILEALQQAASKDVKTVSGIVVSSDSDSIEFSDSLVFEKQSKRGYVT